ncbi:MAG: SDR family NAD(P)-dependent oxidoreductase [Chloroflexi bacterium]|nr:SDR family NAD(P)-dependent oxidoreductase [Chloroflexota bacterium]
MARLLEGKVAVITGGGRGIGRETSLLMASEGARVVAADMFRDADGVAAADKVVKEIKDAGGDAATAYDSVTTMAGGANIIKTAMDAFGKVDILVCCAGNFVKKPFTDLTEAEFDSLMAVHVKGHFSVAKAAVPHMIRQKSGRIITFTSRAAFSGGPNAVGYATAKGAVLGFNSCLSKELKPYNITVNCISPSAVTQLFPGDVTLRKGTDNMPRGDPKVGPDCIAPTIVFLATDDARDITGRVIYSSGTDICLYEEPFKLSSAHVFLRRPSGKWTVNELRELIPTLSGMA